MKALKEGDFQFFDKPRDSSCPGFTLNGYTLRWVSGGVEARRAGRMWSILKVSKIPEKVRARIKDKIPRWCNDDSDTIRKRDLTLAYAPNSEVQERKRDIRREQELNEGIFRGKSSHSSSVKSEGSFEKMAASPEMFK